MNLELKNAIHTFREPKFSYKFSEDNNDGKVNVKQFLKEKKLDNLIEKYYTCLVNPKDYNISHSVKWN